MLKIDFTQEDIDKLHYERYHHPHPLVQKKMEVLYLKSQGIKHKDICSLCKIKNWFALLEGGVCAGKVGRTRKNKRDRNI
jgi:hypothetical protein